MPDFEELQNDELCAWKVLEHYRAVRTKIALRRLLAQSTLRLTDAASKGLAPTDYESSTVLETFAKVRAKAYRTLGLHTGAFRLATLKFASALYLLGLLEDE